MKVARTLSCGRRRGGRAVAGVLLSASLLALGCGGHEKPGKPQLDSLVAKDAPATAFTNVALSMPTYVYPGTVPGGDAVDGVTANGAEFDPGTNYMTPYASSSLKKVSDGSPVTVLSANAYWEVDLGSAQNVAQVEIWGHTDPSLPQPNHDFVVLFSNAQLAQNVPAATLQSDPSVVFQTKIVGAQQMPVQSLPVNATARWLRIQLAGTTSGALYLAEVRALTAKSGTAPTPLANNNSCVPASSTAASAQCVGPWQYHTLEEPCVSFRSTDRSSAACGQELDLNNPIYPTCNWCVAGNNTSSDWVYVTHLSIPTCLQYNSKGICMLKGTEYTATQSCTTAAQNVLANLRGNTPLCYAATTVSETGPASNFQSINLADMQCHYTLHNSPVWTNSASDRCGSATYPTVNKVCDLEGYGKCGDNPGISYSATGLSVPDLQSLYPDMSATYVTGTPIPGVTSQAEIYDAAATAAWCTTCDDIVVAPRAQDAAGAHVLAKAQCLAKQSWQGLDSTTAAQVHTANTINAKLLLETHADQLAAAATAANDTTTIATLEAFYVLDPSVSPSPACGAAPWTVPTQPSCVTAVGSATWTKLNIDMALCARMSGDKAFPIDPAVQKYYAQRCMKTLPDEIKALPAGACNPTVFETRYESFAPAWLSGMLGANSGLSFSSGTNADKNVASMESELALAEDWYDDQLAIQGLTSNLSDDVSTVTQAFWNGVMPNGGYGNVSPTDPNALTTATKNQIEGYREVLRALFDDGVTQPLEADLFAQIYAEALEPIWMRLSDTVLYHDLGCRFADCINTNRASELTDMWAVLSVLHDAKGLTDEVGRFTSATNPSLVTAEWQEVFKLVLKNHQRLETAVSVLTGQPYTAATLVATPTGQLPASLLALQKVAVDARVKMASYRSTGSLGGAMTNVLHTGIQKSQVDTITHELTNATSPLDSDIGTWQSDMPALIADVLAQGNVKADQTSVHDKLTQLITDFGTAESQIAALRQNTAVDDAHFGNFLSGWNSTISGPAIVDGVTTRVFQSTTITPADALAKKGQQPTSETALAAFAVPRHAGDLPTGPNGEIAIPVSEGDTLQVSTKDVWSPICSFGQYTFPAPLFTAATQPKPSGALVGTDGYTLTQSDSGSKAVGQTKSDGTTTSDSESTNDCLTVTLSEQTPPFVTAIGGLSLTTALSSANCLAISHNSTNSNTATKTSSNQDSQSANFATGLRIPINPFSEFPTGALLMVEVPTAANRPWRVQVVHNGSEGMIADAAGTVYLVVNDANGGTCNVTTDQGTLNVTIAQSQSLSGLAKTLGPLMAKELQMFRDGVDENGNVRTGLPQFVAAGAFSSNDRTTMNDAALDDLRAAIKPQTLASMPPEVMSYYQTRVDYELNRIDRAVQINALQIKQQQLALQMQQLADQLSSDSTQSELVQLNSNWESTLLDQSKLRQDTETAATFMMTYIYPILAVRYSDLLGVKGSGFYTTLQSGQHVPVQAIANLLNVDWHDELYTQALKVQAAKNLISLYFTNAEAAAPPINAHPVILSIPRPEALAACATGFCQLSSYPRISPDRAAQFWSDFSTGGKATFNIMPEDLYIEGGNSAAVTCGEVSPVIESLQLAFNTGGDASDYSLLDSTDMRASGNMLFPTSAGYEQFVMDNQSWLGTSAGLVFGPSSSLEGKVLSYMGNAQIHAGFGEGLSPFQTFSVDMHNFLTPALPPDNWPTISSLQEMLVVFELEYSTGDTSYMTACGGGTLSH